MPRKALYGIQHTGLHTRTRVLTQACIRHKCMYTAHWFTHTNKSVYTCMSQLYVYGTNVCIRHTGLHTRTRVCTHAGEREVVVNRAAGEAILKGADVVVPGEHTDTQYRCALDRGNRLVGVLINLCISLASFTSVRGKHTSSNYTSVK